MADVVLLTGAAGGMGRAIARAAVASGRRVVLLDRGDDVGGGDRVGPGRRRGGVLRARAARGQEQGARGDEGEGDEQSVSGMRE